MAQCEDNGKKKDTLKTYDIVPDIRGGGGKVLPSNSDVPHVTDFGLCSCRLSCEHHHQCENPDKKKEEQMDDKEFSGVLDVKAVACSICPSRHRSVFLHI